MNTWLVFAYILCLIIGLVLVCIAFPDRAVAMLTDISYVLNGA